MSTVSDITKLLKTEQTDRKRVLESEVKLSINKLFGRNTNTIAIPHTSYLPNVMQKEEEEEEEDQNSRAPVTGKVALLQREEDDELPPTTDPPPNLNSNPNANTSTTPSAQDRTPAQTSDRRIAKNLTTIRVMLFLAFVSSALLFLCLWVSWNNLDSKYWRSKRLL